MEPELQKLPGLLKQRGTPRVIDLGCGTGRHVSFLGANGVDAYGFDLSNRAVDEAKALLKKAGADADVWVGDMFETLPFEDGSFDGAIATRTIHHGRIKEVRRALGEMNRVTRPGGYVFLQVPELHDPIWVEGRDPENPHADEVEPGTLVWYRGEEALVPHHYFTREELLNLFKGYEIVEMHSRTNHYGGWCLLARKAA